ncbi:hypothetical protein PGT21_025698 [Puccinia graminis f. sp. tritici]|uniref:Uncharacterized protein n=1 Tax=Puccinia graminis f. sp. tritici TaxID=56615 RepID=A0A5B0N546_PUCGR|nr:hypothetical protein PGT21_025698 [Puccinia graminis f. sp. tritici]KAA1092247.1 hypothetical protein PGTUg99_005435 [Puccinia graminis f. sp. tritici]
MSSSPLSLTTTRSSPGSAPAEAYTEPYRLWKLYVIEYEADSEMASCYGAIPKIKAPPGGLDGGCVLAESGGDNERETRGELANGPGRASSCGGGVSDEGPITGTSTETYSMSQSGILGLFLFLGPSSAEIFTSFAALVDTTILPPYFSNAYHQCHNILALPTNKARSP